MLIFKHIGIFVALIIFAQVWHPFLIALAVFVCGFFLPLHIVAGAVGYFLDTVFLSGREYLFAYQNTVIFVILVIIAQYIRKRLVR